MNHDVSSLINFFDRFEKSGFSLSKFAAINGLKPNEAEIILDAGKKLKSPIDWVHTKNMIELYISRTGATQRELAKALEITPSQLSKAKVMKRGLTKKSMLRLTQLLDATAS